MPIVNIRQLARSTSRVIQDVARTGRPAVVTRGGRPVAVVSALDPDALEDWAIENTPEVVRAMRSADADLAAGRTVSLETFLALRRRADRRRAGRGRTRTSSATRGR